MTPPIDEEKKNNVIADNPVIATGVLVAIAVVIVGIVIIFYDRYSTIKFLPITAGAVVDVLAPIFLVALFVERGLEVFVGTGRKIKRTEMDNALDTAIPASPTSDSINEVVQNLGPSASTIVVGTATGTPTTTTMAASALASSVDDFYNGRIIIWTSGDLQNQATDITDYTGSSKLLTFTAVTSAAAATDTFVIV